MPLDPPDFMPAGQPSGTGTSDVLEYRPVPGVTFHREGDGILLYYDQPLVYVAWHRGRLVVATLSDEGYEGPPESARGWKQTFLVAVDPELLRRVADSEAPFRDLYDRPGAETWFVHEDWRHLGNRTWESEYRVYDGVPIPDDIKPTPGVFLDPDKAAAPA